MVFHLKKKRLQFGGGSPADRSTVRIKEAWKCDSFLFIFIFFRSSCSLPPLGKFQRENRKRTFLRDTFSSQLVYVCARASLVCVR